MERATCMWLAIALLLTRGGVAYHGIVLSRSATPVRALRRRYRVTSRSQERVLV